jgi:hypothetical protein
MIMSKTMLGRFEARARRVLQDEFGKDKYRFRSLRAGDGGRFNFDLEHLGRGGVTFAEMETVSRLFDTKGINVSSVYTEGCPTCGGETEYTLEVIGARVDG